MAKIHLGDYINGSKIFCVLDRVILEELERDSHKQLMNIYSSNAQINLS